MMVLALFFPLILLFAFGFAALVTAFWVWMLIDCATNEPNAGNDKLVWILILIFTHWIGALIYYFVRRPQRFAAAGKAKGEAA